MDTILFKYRGLENEYLIFDTNKFHTSIDGHAVRTMCARNYGLKSAGIMVGPYTGRDGKPEMKMYAPDGEEMNPDREARTAGLRYLQDAGYVAGSQKPEAGQQAHAVGKVFLSEEFVNHYLCIA